MRQAFHRGIFKTMVRRNTAVAWLLIAGFLLQPVLAYLVTPVLMHDTKGQQVVVCTLQGEKLVSLDIPGSGAGEDLDHCSALKLYQIAGAAQLPVPLEAPEAVLHAVDVADQTATVACRVLHFSAYPTRAPPIV